MPGDTQPRLVLADGVHRFPAPRWLMFSALTSDRLSWLLLQPGEIEPQVLEAIQHERVVWSSFWPVSPADTIEFDLYDDDGQCAVRFRWFSDAPPDERGIGITRQRLNLKFGGDLRGQVTPWTRNTPNDVPAGPPRPEARRRPPPDAH